MQTSAVEPVYRSGHRSIEGPGLAAVCEGRAPTDSVQPEFGKIGKIGKIDNQRWQNFARYDAPVTS